MDVTGQTRAGNLAAMSDATAAPQLANCDVVYVVRPGELNDNLRYSLRSLINLPHRRVYIAGYIPKWCINVFPIWTDQDNQPDQYNSNHNLWAAVQDSELSDDFVFMNDDFMVMQPIAELPVMHEGPLDERIERYKSGGRMNQASSLITTRRALRKHPNLLSYELHMPMLMNKKRVRIMFAHWFGPLDSLRPRTLYGNMFGIGGNQTRDAKGSSEPQERFISTVRDDVDDSTWRLIRQRFPTPSEYEIGAN